MVSHDLPVTRSTGHSVGGTLARPAWDAIMALLDELQAVLGDSFTFERELTGGGMARVFLAQDTRLGRRVAVKVLSGDIAGAIETERFTREIRLLARLQHPHIVPILSAGEAGGMPYYTMPMILGESLR